MHGFEQMHHRNMELIEAMLNPIRQYVERRELVAVLAKEEEEIENLKVANRHLRKEQNCSVVPPSVTGVTDLSTMFLAQISNLIQAAGVQPKLIP